MMDSCVQSRCQTDAYTCVYTCVCVSTQKFIVEGIPLTCCVSLRKKKSILTKPHTYMLPDLWSGLGDCRQSPCSQTELETRPGQWGQHVTWTSYVAPVPPKASGTPRV